MFTAQELTALSQSPRLPIMARTATESSTPARTSLADIGLLILRIGLGATMLQAGLRKAFDFHSAVSFTCFSRALALAPLTPGSSGARGSTSA